MLKRKIGKRKLEVSAVGLGCMGLSQSYPPFPDKEEAVSFLHQAVEMGQTFYDTSELYGMYQNEELLGEAFRDCRHDIVLATQEVSNLEANQALAGAVTEFADRKELAAAQVALAWLLHQRPWIVPIPGTKTRERLMENMSAAYVELSVEDFAELDRILDGIAVQGERYSADMESMTGR